MMWRDIYIYKIKFGAQYNFLAHKHKLMHFAIIGPRRWQEQVNGGTQDSQWVAWTDSDTTQICDSCSEFTSLMLALPAGSRLWGLMVFSNKNMHGVG